MSTLTKVFVVLQLVFSLILAVLLVMGVAALQNYRSQVEASNQGRIAAQSDLARAQNEIATRDATVSDMTKRMTDTSAELNRSLNDMTTKLAQAQGERDSLEARNSQQQNSISQLTASIDSQNKLLSEKDRLLASVQPENVGLVQKNAELNRANNELQTQNRFAEQAIRKLQEQLATNTGPTTGATGPATNGGTVASLSAGAQTAVQMNGAVTSVAKSAGRTLVQLPLGTRDGVKVNTRFSVYRNSGYVADAVVQSVFPDSSVAMVTVVKPGDAVKAGDMVISGSAQ